MTSAAKLVDGAASCFRMLDLLPAGAHGDARGGGERPSVLQ